MKNLILLISSLLALILAGCSSDSGGTGTSIDANGLVINKASNALASLNNFVAASSIDQGSITLLAGIANAYCTVNGVPTSGTNVSAAYGFCQTTHNSQSPDNARGAMYIAGGMLCEAAVSGLFSSVVAGTPNTITRDIAFSTTCWGSQAEVDAVVADAGATIAGVALSVDDVSGTTAYQYEIVFTIPGDGAITIYTSNSGGISAALNTDGWSFKFDQNTGVLAYESVDTTNSRRVRAMVSGTVATDGTFSALSSIQGFQLENSKLYTFTGNLTLGLKGNSYDTGGPDASDECYRPVGTADCSSLTSIASSDGEATALLANIAAAKTALIGNTGALLNITTIDASDTDITQ